MNDLYLEDFFNFLETQKRYSFHTVNAYKNDLDSFFKFIKKEKSEINQLTIQSYFSNLYVKKLSMKSISRKLSSLKSYAKYLNKHKNINCDFLNSITLPKKERILPEYLHESELEILLNLPQNNFLDIRNSLLIHLLYSTGIRLSELTSLKIEDFSLENNILKVRGKGNKQRIVVFSNKTREVLNLYLKYRPISNSPYLLLNKNNEKLSNRGVELILTNISKKHLGHNKLHPHMLRHTFATKLLNKGMDIRSLQELLGHDSLTATQIYTHVAKNQLLELYQTYHPRGDNDDL